MPKLTKHDINAVLRLLKQDMRTKSGKAYLKKNFEGVKPKDVIEARKDIRKELKKKPSLYRSGAYYQHEPYDTIYSVWVYTKKPNVTTQELKNKLNELFYQHNTNMEDKLKSGGISIEGPNEEIEEDEIGIGQEVNVWYGQAVFDFSGHGIKKTFESTTGHKTYKLKEETRW